MGWMRAPKVAARVLWGGALALAAIVVVALLLTGGSSYSVRLLFSDASGLVTGDQVFIGPSSVGSVKSIGLTDTGQAAIVINIDGDAAPLYRGTVARIEENGLAGIASHYVTLQPAAASGAKIPSGGTIAQDDTYAEVSLDQLFDTINPLTQKGLRNIIRGEATSIKGKTAAANATLEYLAPVLQSTSEVTAALDRYEPSFDQLLVRGAQTMQRLASSTDQLTELVDQTDQATGAIAKQSAALAFDSRGRVIRHQARYSQAAAAHAGDRTTDNIPSHGSRRHHDESGIIQHLAGHGTGARRFDRWWWMRR